ncbi:MAG: FG-GAP-like repeat-containing protein, partial [Bacteroidota bacterium]
MNGDKKDDIVLIDDRNKLVIMTQNAANAAFSLYQNTSLGSSMWSVCVADYNHDGRNDVLTGGAFNNIRLYEGNPTTETLSGSILANSNIFLQGSNFADIDNDGWADIFACHDVGDSRKYKNDGTGVFSFDNSMLNTQAPPSDHSGNYASIWIDYDNDGDLDMYLSKCRQGVSSSSDQRRINRLFQNDGSGNYTEVAAAAGLQIGAQTWGTDFADIDNDGDLDAFVNNHGDDCQLMRNNGNGTFTDVTSGSGLLPTLAGSGSLLGIQAIFRDFDNDGYVDLLFSGSDHYLFYNDGDGTFTLASNPSNPFGSTNIHTFAIGDLNKDGFLDVYAGHGSGFNSLGSATDDLFMNDGNSNHFIAIDLVGTQSNINGIGARLEFYGDWGKQIREVRSGEGYGIMNTFTQHVGLGTYTTLDSLVIRWPSGLVNKYYNLATDQFHCLTEHNNMINASFTVDKNQVFPPPITINFDASESFNPGSGAIAYAWDFGDGNAGTGVSPSHTYTTADSFLVILTVSENVDNTDDKDSLWIVIGNSIDDFPGLDLDADNDGIPDSVETAVGGFTYVIPTLNININGAATTRYVNLSSQNVSIGDQVKLSDFEANGDLNGTNEYLDLNINDGQFVQNSNSTGSQCQGLTAFLTPLTPTVTVIDIGPNIGSATPVPGLKVGTISGTGVGSPGSCGSQAELRFTVKRDAMLDVDGDGIPNYLDLDSDNDGVWDVVEAGGTDADHDAYIDDLANQASLANPTNSDGDSWPNYVDLESGNAANDGTGTFDMAATDFGYFDTNGDGQITAADTDGGTDNDQDGLDDLVDGDLKRKGSALIGEEVFVVGHTIARMWNEVLLAGIRGDFARPTVHARNLHHISAAMFDAWSAYEDEAHFYFLGNGIGGFNIPFSNLPVAADSLAAQKEALSYAAYRLIKHRFGNSPGKNRTIFLADLVMQDQGYSTAVTSTDYQNGGPAELGNYIADRIIAYGLQDNANETGSYENLYYTPDNNFLEIAQPGNPNMTNPNRWQPLAFDVFIDQSGNVISSTVPDFLSPEWGNVPPFAMTDAQKATFNRG